MSNSVCYFLVEDGVVVQKSYPYVEGWVEGTADVAPSYHYADGIFTAPAPPVRPDEEYLAAANEELIFRQARAYEQVAALQCRVDALTDPDTLSMLTDQELSELPAHQEALRAWKEYRVHLGRVSSLVGWPNTPDWPETPE